MKAAVYYETGGPEVFRYEEFPDPVCHPRGLVVDVEAISIEGGDVLHRAGGELVNRPHIVGYQCAGRVREAGAEVEGFKAGDRVVATMPHGSHASVVSVPAWAAWQVPDGLDIKEAACVPIPFGTAGATVLATASTDNKLERLKAYGLDHGINYRERDLVPAVRDLTVGRGVDLVVDSVGTTMTDSLACLAYRGRAITVGNMGRADTRIDARSLMGNNQSLTGVYLGAEMQTERVRTMIARHLDDVAAGMLKVVIDRTFPLSDAAGAHRYIESRQAFGRVVLIP